MPIPPRSPNLQQVIGGAISDASQEWHTTMIGRVESYDADKQLIDVQPLVKQVFIEEDGTRTVISYALIRGVPLQFEGANGYRATYPVVKGDFVELSFVESSIDRWKSNGSNGEEVDPEDVRRFHIHDAIARLGPRPSGDAWTGAATDAATWGKDGGPQIVSREQTIEIGADAANPPTDWAALASLVKTEIGKVRDTLNDLVSTYNGHTHELGAVAVTGLKGVGTGTVVISGTIGLIPTGVPSGSVSSSGSSPSAVSDVKSEVVKVK